MLPKAPAEPKNVVNESSIELSSYNGCHTVGILPIALSFLRSTGNRLSSGKGRQRSPRRIGTILRKRAANLNVTTRAFVRFVKPVLTPPSLKVEDRVRSYFVPHISTHARFLPVCRLSSG